MLQYIKEFICIIVGCDLETKQHIAPSVQGLHPNCYIQYRTMKRKRCVHRKQTFICPHCSGTIPSTAIGISTCNQCKLYFKQPTLTDRIGARHWNDWKAAYWLFEIGKLTDGQLQKISDKQHNEVQEYLNKQLFDKSQLKRIKKVYGV